MRKFVSAIGAGLLALAMATPSRAADLAPPPVYKAPPIQPFVAPAFTWTGFYLGLNGGYGIGSTEWANVSTDEFQIDGGLVGATLGYNLQTGSWVWGAEGDLDASWIKATNANPGSGGVCGGTGGCTTTNNWLGTARGRIGYAWNRWLPYFTGGVAIGSVKLSPNGGTSVTDTQVGWTAGAGVEYAFAGPWSAKFEYLYTDLGKASCDASNCGVSTTADLKLNLFRAGINYRF
jgi:outer membrane immunogenic protein